MPVFSADLSLLTVLDDLISIVDENYCYRAVSAGYTKFFDLKQSDIVGKSVVQLHGKDRFEQHIKPYLDKALAGEDVCLQFWGQNHLGQPRFIDSKHSYYGGLKERAVVVIARDITEHINSSMLLKKEKSMLSTMIDVLPDFIFVKDLQGKYLRCNRSFEAFLAKKNEEIIGFSDDDIMSKRSSSYIKENDKKVLLGKELRCEEWVTYQSGEKRLVDMFKVPFYNENNEVEGLIGIGRDITEERKTESELKLAALVFETTSEPCFILNVKGEIETANVVAKQMIMNLNITKNSSINIDEVIKCQQVGKDFIKNILSVHRKWQGEVITDDGNILLATLNASLTKNNIPDKFVLILRDISFSKAIEADLSHKAYYDYLTGLPNRLQLESNIESAIIRSQRQNRKMAVLFIDLDKFKPINDRFGHFEGDKVLIEVAARLKLEMRKVDLLARIGGDEFVVLIDVESRKQAQHVAEKLIKQLTHPIKVNDTLLSLSASIGISIYPEDAITSKELLVLADQAMYSTKNKTQKICFHQNIVL